MMVDETERINDCRENDDTQEQTWKDNRYTYPMKRAADSYSFHVISVF